MFVGKLRHCPPSSLRQVSPIQTLILVPEPDDSLLATKHVYLIPNPVQGTNVFQMFYVILAYFVCILFTTITDDTVPTYQSPTYPVNPNYKLLLFQNSGKPDPFSPLSLQMSESQSKLPSLPLFTGEQRKKKQIPVSTVSPMSNSWFMFYVSTRPCSNKGFVCYLLLSSCLK